MIIIDEWTRDNDNSIFSLIMDEEKEDVGYIIETDSLTGAYIVHGDYYF